MNISRRNLLRATTTLPLLGAAGVASCSSVSQSRSSGSGARVIVVGGGYGGAIAAKYLKKLDPSLDVLLIEQNPSYVSCPLSNEVLSGERDLMSLTFSYKGLSAQGINIMQDRVVAVDADKQTVTGSSGNHYRYDKLVLSPGVDYRWEAIEGYSEALADQRFPHAWKAGPQTQLLRDQLLAMRDGGVVLIAAPPNPFRCPPGPYERAAQIAHYLHHHKPKSKVMMLDAKDAFSKQGLFRAGWKRFYGDMIEWVGAAGDGKVQALHADSNTLVGEFNEYQGDVINIIPPQKAGKLAFIAGVTDASGWCPVDQGSFASTLKPHIHVIGDASIAGKMPKSGYAANSQGKVCAAAIVAELNGMERPEPSYVNTCYSIISPEYGISVAAVYELQNGSIVPIAGAGGLSPADASDATRAREARFARGWFKNITSDMFS